MSTLHHLRRRAGRRARRRACRRAWFELAVVTLVAAAGIFALYAGTGELALVAVALGAGAIGIRAAFATVGGDAADRAPCESRPDILIVDVAHRRDPPPRP